MADGKRPQAERQRFRRAVAPVDDRRRIAVAGVGRDRPAALAQYQCFLLGGTGRARRVADHVIVHQPACLGKGVDDCRPAKAEPLGLQRLGHLFRDIGGSGNVRHRLDGVLIRFEVIELPEEPVEAFAFFDLQERLGVADGRFYLAAMAHDPSIVQQPFDMALPSFVQHLKILEDAGLIGSRKKGRVRTCYLEQARFSEIEQWVLGMQKYWEGRVDALSEYAEALHKSSTEEGDT